MDFNDIKLRLKRVYSSINKSSDDEIEKYVHIRQISPGQFQITFDKGQEESESTDIVFAIIEHLAKLKDHIKNIIEERGGDKKNIENEIDKSLELKLIIDLANAEKHGYPLTKPERSKRSPKIQNIKHSLVIPPQVQVGFNLSTGEILNPNDCGITITAEIIDKNGNLICRLNKLVNDAIKKWEEIIKKYNIKY